MKNNKLKILNSILLLVLGISILPIGNLADKVEAEYNDAATQEQQQQEQEAFSKQAEKQEAATEKAAAENEAADQELEQNTVKSTGNGTSLGDWKYTEEDGKYVLTTYKGQATDVIMPTKIGGKEVVIKSSASFLPATTTSFNVQIVEGYKATFKNNSAQSMFYNKDKITKLGDLSGLDMSQVTTMESMFSGMNGIKEINLNPYNWDTENIESLRNLFNDSDGLERITWDNRTFPKLKTLDGICFWMEQSLKLVHFDNWDLSQATNVDFYNNGLGLFGALTYGSAYGPIDQITLVYTNWKVNVACKKVVNLDSIANGIHAFDISGLDAPGATTIKMHSFAKATGYIKANDMNVPALTSLQDAFCNHGGTLYFEIKNLNAPQLTSTQNMFGGSTGITTIDVSNWKAPLLNNTSSMFKTCRALTNFKGLETLPMNKVTNTSYMFYDCDGLTQVDLSAWTIDALENARNMFAYSDNMTYVNLSGLHFGDSVRDMNNLFYVGRQTPLTVVTKEPKLQDNTYNYNGDHRVVRNITFDANGGQFSDGKTKKQVSFKSIAVPTPSVADAVDETQFNNQVNDHPTRTDYKFMGWAPRADGEVNPTPDIADIIGDRDPTYFAIWSAKITVNFDNNGGEGLMDPQEVYSGESINLANNKFTKPGFAFQGWSVSGNEPVEYTDGAAFTDTSDTPKIVTLKAIWKKADSYTLNYDANNGQGTIPSTNYEINTSVTLNDGTSLSRTGYTLLGWDTNAQATQPTYQLGQEVANGLSQIDGTTVTLYAIWQANTYTVTFHGGEGATGSMNPQTLTFDKAQQLTANAFNKEGYTFKGWSETENGTDVAYRNEQSVTNLADQQDANIDLYAVFEANKYQITFNGNKGTGSTDPHNVPAAVEKTYGTATNAIQEPTRGGYTFKGWATTAEGPVAIQPGVVIDQDFGDGTASQELFAIWEAKTYEVTFDKGADDAMGTTANQTLTFDQEAKLTANGYSRLGYKFLGWSPTKGDTTPTYTNEKLVTNLTADATNTTLYAVWEKVTSVTVNGQDGQPSTEDDVEINGPTVNQTPEGVQLPDGGTIKFPNSNKPDQTITLPNNSVVRNDGVVTLPNNNQILPTPDGSITLPGADKDLNGKGDNVVVNNPNGNYEVSEEGNVKLPQGGTVNVGNQGNITVPNNTTVNNDGSITFPDANTNTNKPSVTIKPQTDGTIKLPGKEDKFDVTLTPNGGMTNIQPDSQGNITLPQGGTVVTPNGTIDAPAGSIVWPDGTVVDKNGNVLNPDGSITVPGKDQTTGTDDDVTVKPNDKGEKPSTNDQGNVVVPDGGQVVLPGNKPVTPPNGSIVTPNGEIITPGGPVINPDGTVTLPGEDGKVPAPDNKDNITIQGTTNIPTVDEQGNVTIPQGGGTITPNDPATGNAGTSTTLPENSVVSPNGIVTMPQENDHVTINPNPVQVKPESNGNITLPGKDGDINNNQTNVTVQGNGSQLQPNGDVSLPNGGTVTTPNGTINAPSGSTVYPDGTVVDKDGNILNPDGSITVPGKDQTQGTEDDVTITPKPGTNLEPQQNGNIKLPEGGDVTINGNTLPVPPNTQVKPNGDIITPNGQTELRPNTDGTITLPGQDGSLDQSDKDNVIVDGKNPTIGEDGTITLPEGGDVTVGGKPVTVPNGSQVKPDGTIIFPDHNDNVNKDNIAVKPNVDGTITLPGADNDIDNKGDNPTVTPNNGNWKPDSQGNITLPEGGKVNVNGHDTQAPAGSIVWPDGTIQLPNNGGLIKPDGTLAVPGPDLKPGNEDDVIVKPQPQGSEKPQPDGSIVLPNGGEVVPDNGNGKPTTVPNGTIVNPDGTVTVPGPDTVTGENVTVKPNGDGSITVPGPDKDPNNGNDNVTVKPNDKGDQPTINPDGTVTVPDGGKVDTPAGEVTPPNGSVVNPDGSITTPNGPIIKPDGNVTTGPDHNTTVPPVDGNIPKVDENGNTHVPNGGTVVTPQGPVTVPDGTIVKPDGTIVGPNGEIINPDGSITVPGADHKPGTNDDVTVKPNGNGDKPTVNPDGNVTVPDNAPVILPGNKPVTPPNGSVVTPEGEIITPGGVIINPDGSVTIPGEDGKLPAPNDKDNITVMPNDGNPKVDENGNVSLPNGGTITPNNPTTGKPGTSTTLPNGSQVKPDGIVTMPEANDQVTIKPNPVHVKPNADGSITLPGKDGQLPSQDDVTVNGNGAELQPNGNVTLPNGGTVVTPDGTINAPAGSTVLPDGTVIGPNGEIFTSDGRGWINAQDTTVHSSQAIADITSLDALIPAMNAQAQYDGKAVTPSVSTADLASIQAGNVGSYPVTFTLTGPQTRALGPNQASVTRIYTIINDEQQLPTPQPQPEVVPTPQAKPQTPTGVKVSLVSALVLSIAALSLVVVKRNRK